ncbi:MAG: hypothetical protein WCT18_02335 [Patescibacteria group bacterium]
MEQLYPLKQKQEQLYPIYPNFGLAEQKAQEISLRNILTEACARLEQFLDRDNYPLDENDFLFADKGSAYGWENPQVVQLRVEKRLLLKKKIRELALLDGATRRNILQMEIAELEADLQNLNASPEEKERQQKLEQRSRNALRTGWAKNVFGEMDLATRQILETKKEQTKGFECFRFIHHLCVNAFRRFLEMEKEANIRGESTEKIFSKKREFIVQEMTSLVKVFEDLSADFLQQMKSAEKPVDGWELMSDFDRLAVLENNPRYRHLANLYYSLTEYLNGLGKEKKELLKPKLREAVFSLIQ